MRGKDRLVVAGAVGSCSYHSSEGLVRDGSEVDHGEAMSIEGCMQALEDDAALCDEVVLFGVDLKKRSVKRSDARGARACAVGAFRAEAGGNPSRASRATRKATAGVVGVPRQSHPCGSSAPCSQ